MDKGEKILELRSKGLSYSEIMKELDVTKSLVAFYCNEKRQKERFEKLQKSKEKKEEYEKIVCELIKESTNLNQVCIRLNKRSTNTNYLYIKDIISKYNLDISHFTEEPILKKCKRLSIEEILSLGSKISSSKIKERLIKEGIKEWKCEKCQRTEWEGEKIPLELHHINGNRNDNRIENLKLLCCNCHAQTDNFCGKNIKKTKKIKITICKNCGNEFEFNGKKFCSDSCKEEYVNKKLKEISKCPSKEDLLNDFKELKSFLQISKKYDVSDKTIAKWFQKYSLPFKSNELKEYIKSIQML